MSTAHRRRCGNQRSRKPEIAGLDEEQQVATLSAEPLHEDARRVWVGAWLAFLHARGESVRYIHGLLTATASRPVFSGCFGLHEWAMVYRDPEHRHELPLRLGQAETENLLPSTTHDRTSSRVRIL